MSSLLTLSVQRSNNIINNNVSSDTAESVSSSSSSSSSTSCLIPPQPQSQQPPQMPAVCGIAPTTISRHAASARTFGRNGRKRPALNLPPLHLQPALEHRRRENDARLRDTKAQIEASFLSEAPSSPGGCSNNSDSSQPSGSDDDSSNSNGSNSGLCSSSKFEKRIRFDSTPSSAIFTGTESVENLDGDLSGGSSGCKSSAVHESIFPSDEYQIMLYGEELQVLEKSTNNLFQAIKMDSTKYKHFMKVAARIESARKLFPLDEFKRLKSRMIPIDTRIVHGSRGISYLLMPCHHASLSFKVKDRQRLLEKDVQGIVIQIVEMMQLCHQVGLFFGDFKFEKFVFMDSKMTQIRPRSPLIFLVSSKVEDDTMFNPKVGWAFMAPEMLNRRQTPFSGIAADMWALGVLTFTLLVGNYPFIANEPQTLFTRIRNRNINAKNENFASPEAKIMVYSLLCKNPSDRPSAQRLMQCHWLKMRPEDFTNATTKAFQPSDCAMALRNFDTAFLATHAPHFQMRQFLTQQLEEVQQRLAQFRSGHLHTQPQSQPQQGTLPRVGSDRRLNHAMEHRLAMYRAQSSDQVVPATAHVLLPTMANSNPRISLLTTAPTPEATARR